jgi:hypothetical protein
MYEQISLNRNQGRSPGVVVQPATEASDDMGDEHDTLARTISYHACGSPQ